MQRLYEDDIEVPQTLIDLFSDPAQPSGNVGVRRHARVSRSLVSDYIAATAERNAAGPSSASSIPRPDSAPDSLPTLSLDQFLGAPPGAARSSPPSRARDLHPRGLGTVWSNQSTVNLRDRERDELERDRRRFREVFPWTAARDTHRRLPGSIGNIGNTRPSTSPPNRPTTRAEAIANTTSTLTAASTADDPPANRARRTILQDTAPRPRQQQIVPSGSHFSWVSYVPSRSLGRERTTPAESAPAAGTSDSVMVDNSRNAAEAGSSTASNTATTRPNAGASTTRDRTRSADRNAERSERNERMATTVLRRRRTGERPTQITYGFDPADISPPGGDDDHIWDMLGDPDSDDDDRWGMYLTRRAEGSGAGQAAGVLDPLYLDGWGTPPDSGAALSRGGFNRRRQSFRASREVVPDWDTDEIAMDAPSASRPASALPPTNIDVLARVPAPIVVGETRPRPDDEAETSSAKRRKRTMSRPSYLSYTTLPLSADLPQEFDEPDARSHLDVSPMYDGRLRISFAEWRGNDITGHMDDSCAVRTTHPIPPGIGVFYFEAEVLCTGKGANITLGFMLGDADLRRLVGWDIGTWGWHGDDGKVFEQVGEGREFSEPWTVGEILGLGIDYTQSRAFLTRNGVLQGHVFQALPQRLHVAVGMQSAGEAAAINLSGPFKYDIDAHARQIRDRVRAQLAPPPPSFSENTQGRVPRIAGVPPRPRPDAPPLPEGSPFTDRGEHAQAVLVLDYLASTGNASALALVQRDMARRGWIPAPRPPPPPAPALDSPISAYPSPSAGVAALSRALNAGGTPRMPLRLLGSIDMALDTAISRRLRVYEFAALAAEAAGAEGMDVDGDVEANEGDLDASALARASALSREAKDEKWAADEVAFLGHACGILAGGAARESAEAAVRAMRRKDAVVIERAARAALGIADHSLLHLAIAQTGLVHQVLADKGDGEVAFVSVADVIGAK